MYERHKHIKNICDCEISIKFQWKFVKTDLRLVILNVWFIKKQHIHKMNIIEMRISENKYTKI